MATKEREYTDREREWVKKTPEHVQQLLIDINFETFYNAAMEEYDLEDFIGRFMRSDTAAHLDFHLNRYRWEGAENLFPDFLYECVENGIELKKHITKENTDIYYKKALGEKAGWVGYIYRLTHFKTGETSREIVDFMPVRMMLRSYGAGHYEDPDGFIEDYYFKNDYEKFVKYFE